MKQNGYGKKTLAWLCAAILLLSLLPMSGFALRSEDEPAAETVVAAEPVGEEAAEEIIEVPAAEELAEEPTEAPVEEPAAEEIPAEEAAEEQPAAEVSAAEVPAAEEQTEESEDGDPTPTEGWNACGTCEWQIDTNGKLTIRPIANGTSGTLAAYDWYKDIYLPWCLKPYNTQVLSVEVKPGVAANANSEGLFDSLENCTEMDLACLDTSNVETMAGMFYDCYALESLDLSSFDTSKVEDMYCLFYDCYALESVDLSSFDTSNVWDMSSMFEYCQSLTTLDLSSFDTANVEYMYDMFEYCYALESVDLSSFDTSKVEDMDWMFDKCYKLQSLDLSNFDTSNVDEMDGMFECCKALEYLDLSGFDTSKVEDMNWMFCDCTALKTIIVSDKFVTTALEDSEAGENMFSGCEAIVGGAGTAYDEEHVDSDYALIDGGESNPGYFTANTVTLLEGAGQSFTTGGSSGLGFRSNGLFVFFKGVKVDGSYIDASDYTAKEGSTIVTLKPAYLETLSAGTHTLSIVSSYGSADTTFIITAAAQNPIPDSGDHNALGLWICLAGVSVIALGAVLTLKRREN